MKKRRILNRVLGICIAVFAIGAIGVGSWYIYQDYGKHESDTKATDELIKMVVKEPEKTEPTGPVGYQSGMDENLLRQIDFGMLISQNSDATRWMYVPGTAIDAAVMQERTVNQYYYNLRGFNKSYNGSGSFLVPATPKDSDGDLVDDAHILILGHRMNSYNGEWQFSNLPTRWGDAGSAAEYPYVYIYYGDRAERWKVWAGLDVWCSDMLYDIPYKVGSEDYENLITHMQELARYQLTDAPDKDTRTLILSTCNRPNGGALIRFALVCVPDATYYYETNQYVDANDSKVYQKWVDANKMEYDSQIREIDESFLIQMESTGGDTENPTFDEN